MEMNLTQDQLREVVLAALLDYETLKKTRRLKAVKKTLQGTMVATLIGSAGVMAANQGRSNQVREASAIMAPASNVTSAITKLSTVPPEPKFIPAVAHFGFNRYTLSDSQKERLEILIKQIPKNSEITVIGLTDNSGSQNQNKKIGKLRARSVADFMTAHGLKVKTIESKVSNDMPENWMERRVDILVDSLLEPFFLNLTSPEKQQSPVASQAQPNSSPVFHPIDNKSIQQETNRSEQVENKLFVENTKSQDAKAEKSAKQRQRVHGVVHFALNSFELASAHKERLKELIAQLPKDSELMVIGRTESNGAENTIEKLGSLRAKSVATFLASNGMKVVAVGSRDVRDGFTGWGARSVDIIVDSSPIPNKIKLNSPFN